MCVLEARPAVLVVSLIRFATGAAISARVTGHPLVARTVAGAVGWELAIFSAYLFNGIMDVPEDRVNGSRRPIATGALSRRAAGCWAAAAAALSLASAARAGLAAGCAVTVILLLGWQYSARPWYLKRRPAGPAVVAAASGLLAYFTGYSGPAGGWPHPAAGAVAFAAAMAAWMTFVGAPAKDLSDVPGDAAAGRRTLPVLFGERATRRVVVTAALVIAAAFAAVAASTRPLAWPAAALAAGAIAITLLSRQPGPAGSRTRRRTLYKVFMITQYTANVCLLLAIAA